MFQFAALANAAENSFLRFAIPVFLIGLFEVLLILLYLYMPNWISHGVKLFKMLPSEKVLQDLVENESYEKALEYTGFAYEPGQDIFHSIMYPWQRNFGYCRLYDEAAAPLSLIIDCEPITFEYDNKRWMIEFWKGQYGMTTGGEIGIFYTEDDDLDIPEIFTGTFYNSVSDIDLLDMSFTLRKKNKPLFTRKGRHWWLTGFVLGEFADPADLKMDIQITLKDWAMCAAFVKGLQKAGYAPDELDVKNHSVRLQFGKAHTPQPITRTASTDWIMQRKNELLCKEYQNLTKDFATTPEKLKAVQEHSPEMYTKVLNMGKTKQVYSAYSKLYKFVNK